MSTARTSGPDYGGMVTEVPHLCPDLDVALRLVRRRLPADDPDRQAIEAHIEAARLKARQLRMNATNLEILLKRAKRLS